VVKLNGEPLRGGQVLFRPADGRYPPVSATIDENGNYSVKLPPGEALIVVDNRGLTGEDRGAVPTEAPSGKGVGAPPGVAVGPPSDFIKSKMEQHQAPAAKKREKAGTYVEIPESYASFETSGLRYTVASGGQTHDIELRK
jgi:hypothetical protein